MDSEDDRGFREKLERKAEGLEPEQEVPFQDKLARLSDRFDGMQADDEDDERSEAAPEDDRGDGGEDDAA